MTEDHRDTPDGVETDSQTDVQPGSDDEGSSENVQAYHKTALQTAHPEAVSDIGNETLESRDMSTLPPGDVLGETLIDDRYQLHEQLGEGGMGSVYRATHVLMDKPVAVKLIHGSRPDEPRNLSLKPKPL